MQEHAFDTAVLDDEAPGPEPVTPTEAVTPLTYTQLRLLAEYTAALEADVEFVVTPGHTLAVATDPTDDDVLIPAAQGGKFPPMVVELFAEHDGIVSEPLRLPPRCADAVFWSDAAVAQFLYPYYASKCGLRQGPGQLFWLSFLWTGRIPDLWHLTEPVLPPVLAARTAQGRGEPGAASPPPHTLTPSHPHTLTPSYPLTRSPAHPLTRSPAHL